MGEKEGITVIWGFGLAPVPGRPAEQQVLGYGRK